MRFVKASWKIWKAFGYKGPLDLALSMDSETLGKRIKAAMILAGVTQAELGEKFARDDLGKEDPGRIIRGERVAGPSRIDAFVKHLGMPREWFTVEDLEAWLTTRPPAEADDQQTAERESDLAAALASMAEMQLLLERALGDPRRAGQS